MMRAVTPTAKRRLSRADWEQAALDAIAREGVSGVAVEPLAQRLGVTKGSFYAHFRSREQLIDAALSRWESSHGESLSELSAIEDPRERLDRTMLAAVQFSQSPGRSIHVRLLGEIGVPRVREALARVSAERIARIAASYRELGLGAAAADARARIAYATYLGLLQMALESPDAPLDAPAIDAVLDEIRGTLLRP
jgi:AcrR family transcriptional regulator